MNASERISTEARVALEEAITDAGGGVGNEVFFLGTLAGDIVTEVRVLARGNEFSVPAVSKEIAPGSVVLHNHPSGELTPSDADLNIAASFADGGVAFYIINNSATNVYVVTEPFTETPQTLLDGSEIAELISAGGPIGSELPGYEVRPEQIEMAGAVTEAFNDSKILLVEAGTGVGKSLAYLVPSILFALANNERVVISTKTINLQEQLIRKDIPFLKSALGKEFKAVLVKGRSNYLCMRKLTDSSKNPELPSLTASADEERAITEWAGQTNEGCLSDLGFTPAPGVWERYSSETDTCLRLKCSYYKDCFFNRARREAASAELLVVNHHLLFSDIAIKESKGVFNEAAVLPPFKRLIIDEAHNTEEIATEYFGEAVSSAGVAKQLGRLRSKKNPKKGLLPFLASRIQKLHLPLGTVTAEINSKMLERMERCHVLSKDAFATLYHFFQSVAGSSEPVIRLRLTKLIREHDEFADVETEVRKMTGELKKLSGELKKILQKISKEVDVNSDTERALLPAIVEVRAMAARLAVIAQATESILFADGEESVRWVQVETPAAGKRARPMRVVLNKSPLAVGPRLKEALYNNLQTIVMTSATLSVKKRFDFIRERTGLDLLEGSKRAELLLDSPFDYSTQVELYLVEDLPDPTSYQYSQGVSKLIPGIVTANNTDGVERGTLALFTSYKLLNSVYNESRPAFDTAGINLMRQGERPRTALLEAFKEDVASTLYGTDSFWEGVDVPGPALATLIITRLPFEVPNDPVAEARQIDIEKRGGNAFREYIVPNAVIKFRQGFGRLVRKKTDSGKIFVLDGRITAKSYGKSFLNSIPECRVVRGRGAEILRDIKDKNAKPVAAL